MAVSLACSMAARAGAAELAWSAPPGCPEHAEVVFRIERALGGSLAEAPPLHLRVGVQRARGGAFTASLDAEGRARTLTAPDCIRLADAVAVAVSLALGVIEPAVPERPSTREPLEPPAAVPSIDAPASSAPAPSGRAGPRPSVSAWLLGDAGSLPRVGAGAALGVELGWDRLQLRAQALLLFEQHVDRSGQAGLGPAAGADLALVAGSVLACAAVASFRDDGAFFLCAGPELGRLSGSGTGVSARKTGGGTWLAPRIDLGVAWRVTGSSLALGALASAVAPLLRDDFVLETSVPVHRAASVVGRLSFGVVLHLD
jgi:hypothetical protein